MKKKVDYMTAKNDLDSLEKMLYLCRSDPERIVPVIREAFRRDKPITIHKRSEKTKSRLFQVYNGADGSMTISEKY